MTFAMQAFGEYKESPMASSLKRRDYKDATDLVLNMGGGTDGMDNYVRRLTPLEAERLQGLPDNWTLIGDFCGYETWKDENGNEYPVEVYKYKDDNGKLCKTSDSARFEALGNGICLPFWAWLLKRIAAQYERPATLGSCFDGIASFPLIWERLNGEGSDRKTHV